MKERKQAKDWYIAATHWLTAGFVMPFLVSLIAGLIIFPFLKLDSIILTSIISIGLAILAIWLGVMYSASYLRKKYVIKDKDKIVKLATTYLVVLRFALIIISFWGAEKLMGLEITFEIVGSIFVIVLFYLFSRKYITSTENLPL